MIGRKAFQAIFLTSALFGLGAWVNSAPSVAAPIFPIPTSTVLPTPAPSVDPCSAYPGQAPNSTAEPYGRCLCDANGKFDLSASQSSLRRWISNPTGVSGVNPREVGQLTASILNSFDNGDSSDPNEIEPSFKNLMTNTSPNNRLSQCLMEAQSLKEQIEEIAHFQGTSGSDFDATGRAGTVNLKPADSSDDIPVPYPSFAPIVLQGMAAMMKKADGSAFSSTMTPEQVIREKVAERIDRLTYLKAAGSVLFNRHPQYRSQPFSPNGPEYKGLLQGYELDVMSPSDRRMGQVPFDKDSGDCTPSAPNAVPGVVVPGNRWFYDSTGHISNDQVRGGVFDNAYCGPNRAFDEHYATFLESRGLIIKAIMINRDFTVAEAKRGRIHRALSHGVVMDRCERNATQILAMFGRVHEDMGKLQASISVGQNVKYNECGLQQMDANGNLLQSLSPDGAVNGGKIYNGPSDRYCKLAFLAYKLTMDLTDLAVCYFTGIETKIREDLNKQYYSDAMLRQALGSRELMACKPRKNPSPDPVKSSSGWPLLTFGLGACLSALSRRRKQSLIVLLAVSAIATGCKTTTEDTSCADPHWVSYCTQACDAVSTENQAQKQEAKDRIDDWTKNNANGRWDDSIANAKNLIEQLDSANDSSLNGCKQRTFKLYKVEYFTVTGKKVKKLWDKTEPLARKVCGQCDRPLGVAQSSPTLDNNLAANLAVLTDQSLNDSDSLAALQKNSAVLGGDSSTLNNAKLTTDTQQSSLTTAGKAADTPGDSGTGLSGAQIKAKNGASTSSLAPSGSPTQLTGAMSDFSQALANLFGGGSSGSNSGTTRNPSSAAGSLGSGSLGKAAAKAAGESIADSGVNSAGAASNGGYSQGSGTSAGDGNSSFAFARGSQGDGSGGAASELGFSKSEGPMVSAMGSTDPEDYFNRIRVDESLFKRVERKYTEKAFRWERAGLPKATK